MILPIGFGIWQFAADRLARLNLPFGKARFRAYVEGVAGNCVSNALPQRLHRDTLPLLRGPFFCRTGPFFLSSDFVTHGRDPWRVPLTRLA